MTNPVIVPPKVTDASVLYLNDSFDDDATAHTLVPNPRPERFVTVERAGGFMRDRVIFTATLLCEAWGTTDDDASDLADLAYALMLAIPGRHHDVTFFGVDTIAGPAQLPDVQSDQPRYVFTLAVRARAHAI